MGEKHHNDAGGRKHYRGANRMATAESKILKVSCSGGQKKKKDKVNPQKRERKSRPYNVTQVERHTTTACLKGKIGLWHWRRERDTLRRVQRWKAPSPDIKGSVVRPKGG